MAAPKGMTDALRGLIGRPKWPDIPFEVGPEYDGEKISAKDMYCEFGGPNVKYKAEAAVRIPPEEIRDEEVTIIGPDIPRLEKGGCYPFGILAEMDEKAVSEETITLLGSIYHIAMNCIHGVMHLNARDDIWIRISNDLVQKGFTLKYMGKILARLMKGFARRTVNCQIKIITDPDRIKGFVEKQRLVWKKLDEKVAGMKEEDTRPWYSCVLCQSFAPSHVCIVTPQRTSNCGVLNWTNIKAAHEMDPEGVFQPFDPGELLDPVKGEWSGANEVVTERSGGINKRFYLHSMFELPHTSCGCFECLAVYIREVDGIGIVDRKYTDPMVSGLTFSTLAARAGGGCQTEGILGISKGYMKSSKFLQGDAGWNRIVWMPNELKQEVLDSIPEDLRDKVATEKEASNIVQLKEFLKQKKHPITERWAKPITADELYAYLEAHGGELELEKACEELGTNEKHIMEAVEELKRRKLIE